VKQRAAIPASSFVFQVQLNRARGSETASNLYFQQGPEMPGCPRDVDARDPPPHWSQWTDWYPEFRLDHTHTECCAHLEASIRAPSYFKEPKKKFEIFLGVRPRPTRLMSCLDSSASHSRPSKFSPLNPHTCLTRVKGNWFTPWRKGGPLPTMLSYIEHHGPFQGHWTTATRSSNYPA